MEDEERDAEYASIKAEHAALLEEHERLHKAPRDFEAHLTHSQRLRAHVDRLHAYIDAGRRAKPSSP